MGTIAIEYKKGREVFCRHFCEGRLGLTATFGEKAGDFLQSRKKANQILLHNGYPEKPISPQKVYFNNHP